MVRAVVPPTVAEGTQRVRVCLHAGNTVTEVGRLVGALEEWCVERAGEGEGEGARKKDGEERVGQGEVVLARL